MSLGSRLTESAIIGLLAGGWASCTYWEGAAGIFMGILAFLMAMFFLTIVREDEERTERIRRKSASPYKRQLKNS